MINKFIVSLVGVIANALAAGILPEEWVAYAVALVSMATAFGVYTIPNSQPSKSELHLPPRH